MLLFIFIIFFFIFFKLLNSEMLQDCDQNFSEMTIFHIQVGINNATLVPEAEAASFYCQVSPLHRINTRNGEMICLQTLGMKYLMLDLGGKILLYVIEVLVFCRYVYPLPLSFCLQMNFVPFVHIKGSILIFPSMLTYFNFLM